MTHSPGELLLYPDPSGATRHLVRLVDGTVSFSQALMARLYREDVRTINEYRRNVLENDEPSSRATFRNFRIVHTEGYRDVSPDIAHYSLPTLLPVGNRVRSPHKTRSRQGAAELLRGFVVKRFAMDDVPSEHSVAVDTFKQRFARGRHICPLDRRCLA